MEIKRPDVSHLPFEVPENIDPTAYLLLGDPERKSQSLLARVWLPGVSTICPGLTAVYMRHVYRRPLFSSMHRILGVMAVGGLLGEWGYHAIQRHYAERDLQYFHYICLHPEDFQAPERVKFRDFLTEWHPIR